MKEGVKTTTNWTAFYFTNPKSWYPVQDCLASFGINLSIDGRLERDRLVVTEYLSENFSSMGKGIGGEQANDLTEEHFIEHSSLHFISTYIEQLNDSFGFRPVNHYEVKDALENLNTRKATGYMMACNPEF